MKNYNELIHAINIVNGCPMEGIHIGSFVKQLAISLRVYADRGEFDGTVDSAIDCLNLAGYEFQKDSSASCKT